MRRESAMPSEALRADASPFDVSDDDVERHLMLCDGDPRETIRQLLVGQAYLERRISLLLVGSSRGFSRGRADGLSSAPARSTPP